MEGCRKLGLSPPPPTLPPHPVLPHTSTLFPSFTAFQQAATTAAQSSLAGPHSRLAWHTGRGHLRAPKTSRQRAICAKQQKRKDKRDEVFSPRVTSTPRCCHGGPPRAAWYRDGLITELAETAMCRHSGSPRTQVARHFTKETPAPGGWGVGGSWSRLLQTQRVWSLPRAPLRHGAL